VGGGAPRDRGVSCGEGLGRLGTRVWRDGARTARGGGWWRVGIRGVAGGRAPEEDHEECRLRWPTLLVPSQPTGIKSVTLVHVPTLLS
jgi:hypothetical protein